MEGILKPSTVHKVLASHGTPHAVDCERQTPLPACRLPSPTSTAPVHRSQLGESLVLVAIVGAWMYGWAGNLILTLQFGRYVDETLSTIVRSSSLSDSVTKLTLAVSTLALVAAIGLCLRAKNTAPIQYLAALLLPWIVLYPMFLIGRGMHFIPRDILYPLFVTAIYFVRPSILLLGRLIAVIAVITAATSIAMGLFAGSVALMPAWWNGGKAILGDSILAGLYGHSNQLGTILAISVPFVVGIYNSTRRNVYLSIILVALMWSSSRSSLISVAAFGTVLLISNALASRDRRSPNQRANILLGAILAGVATAILLPILTRDPEAFTNRGRVWQASLDYWSRSPWVGGGASILQTMNSLTQSIGGPVNTSHNVLLTFVTTGGLITVVPVAIAAVAITVRAAKMYRSGEAIPLLVMLMMAFLSIAEDPVRVLHLGPQSFIVWTGLALIFCIPRLQSERSASQVITHGSAADQVKGFGHAA